MAGEYIPLKVEGEYKNNFLAFARKHGKKWLIVAVPLFMAKLCGAESHKISRFDWAATKIILPEQAPHKWQSMLNKNSMMDVRGTLGLNKINFFLPLIIYENIE